MNTTAATLAANGKLFAVAPMMNGKDSPMKSICYKAPCVKTLPTLTPPGTEGIALIMLECHPFLRGHRWTRNTTPQILIFPNEINGLGGLTCRVNVGCVFTLRI